MLADFYIPRLSSDMKRKIIPDTIFDKISNFGQKAIKDFTFIILA